VLTPENPDPIPAKTEEKDRKTTRQFESGATRDQDADKLHYEGYISPIVLLRYAIYMKKHEKMADGTTRAPDNWQKGIPKSAYIESLLRHVMTLWLDHDGYGYLSNESYQDTLCAVIFNASGLLFEDYKTDGLSFDSDNLGKSILPDDLMQSNHSKNE
jgi:hypothetical protein